MIGNIAILLACGGFWGLSFTLTRIVMEDGGGHPLAITFWNTALATVIVWTLLWATGRLPRIDRSYLRFVAVLGVLGGACPSILLFWAAQHVGAGVLSVCMATVPLMQISLSAVLGIERFRLSRLFGLLMGLAAVWLIADPDDGTAPLLWVLVAIGGGLSYALEDSFIAMRRPDGPSSVQILGGMVLFAALYTAPALAFVDPAPLSLTAPGRVETAFLAMTLGGIVAYGSFVHLITRAGPVFGSQVAYVVTVSGVLCGVLLLGEEYATDFWVALALIIVGLAFGLPGGKGRSPARP
ncbi:MAG: DMT family transporter [Pseudomonadota bacterium]